MAFKFNHTHKTFIAFVIHFVQLICAAILTGGIAEQAQYGPSNTCLLFISNYQRVTNTHYLFTAISPSCSFVVAIGAIGIILSLVLGAGSLFFLFRNESRAGRVILVFFVISTIYSILLLVASSVASAGIRTTCGFLEQSGTSCDAIFAGGFFEDTDQTYIKNLTTVYAAIGAGWFGLIVWIAYTVIEFRNWKASRNTFNSSGRF
ncbi:uncharacterized protein BJ171DRAFT_581969 [Polychytrium aggregatum]|uniref:uncharacterized protein n=1 Tax=Polychytrium aggregatum TaxID=110093 RepID=UPI0022FDEAE1|nr:uncharacterized protein BJ171DRAFT_581969 [Polychytrium aggregatum]KAI9204391.1 hypothetical protein BJ171DRAFT_581969 [Polychytrium aggregatum]